MYICQVESSQLQPRAFPQRHCLISVHPEHLRPKEGDRWSQFAPTAISSSLTRTPDEDEEEGGRTLGPVTERYVVVAAGENVVLECRDADDNWVYWKKRGGEVVVVNVLRERERYSTEMSYKNCLISQWFNQVLSEKFEKSAAKAFQ